MGRTDKKMGRTEEQLGRKPGTVLFQAQDTSEQVQKGQNSPRKMRKDKTCQEKLRNQILA